MKKLICILISCCLLYQSTIACLAYSNEEVLPDNYENKMQGIEGETYSFVINNEDELNGYLIDFGLAEGEILVSDYEYEGYLDEYDCGNYFIIDENENIAAVIEPLAVYDKNGKAIKAKFNIINNKISFEVLDQQGLDFPIILVTTSHPTRYEYRYFTRSQVRTMRDNYTESTVKFVLDGIACVLGLADGLPLALNVTGNIWCIMRIMSSYYNTIQFNTWDNIYVNFSKNYAKVAFPYTWHTGHRSYYPHGNLVCTYTQSNS